MATNTIFLPSENYEPYFRTLREFSRAVEENNEVIRRIAQVIDVDLTYPEINHLLKIQHKKVLESLPYIQETPSPDYLFLLNDPSESDPKSEEAEPERPTEEISIDKKDPQDRSESFTKRTDSDPLRYYLDDVLRIGTVLLNSELSDKLIKNEKAKRLIEDNYRLVKLKQNKLEKNQGLLKILTEYEMILSQVILPRLSQEVSKQNTRTLKLIKENILPEYNLQSDRIWSKYLQYIEALQQIRRLTDSVCMVMTEHLELSQINRLGGELQILEKFLDLSQRLEGGI